ncbi:MAG: hypothetical protein PHW95_02085 [Patescibacteria group bacterium]|nr:hypothetical protein [Patescibacteria group bacterium]
MTIKLKDVITKADWIKIIILIVVSIGCWTWVYVEFQKPIVPPSWANEGEINFSREQR